jgi:hypothetical protein
MAMKPIQNKLSKRTQALLSHPQGMGNYFTFKSAIDILGLDWNDVAPGGCTLSPARAISTWAIWRTISARRTPR